MRIRSVLTHTAQAVAEGSLIAMLIVGLMAGSAFAGKPGGSATSGVSVTVADQVFGGTATATVSGKSGLYVYVKCSQAGGTALSAWERTDSNNQASFSMGPTPSWSSGSATCVAEAGHFDRRGRWQIEASTGFAVSG